MSSVNWAPSAVLTVVFFCFVSIITPNTFLSEPFESLEHALLCAPGADWAFRHVNIPQFLHGLSVACLAICTLSYAGIRIARRSVDNAVVGFTDSICLLSVLYLGNFVLHPRLALDSIGLCWPYLGLSLFFAVLVGNAQASVKLCKALLALIVVQCIYAVAYHIFHLNPFSTPQFGSRASGTFNNPNVLYPLCLLGLPLCAVQSQAARFADERFALRFGVIVIGAALYLTYSRAAWIALAAVILYLAYSPNIERHKNRKFPRIFATGLAILLMIGASTVRTHGDLIGNRHDRSFWGRMEIWRVAGISIEKHPWIGAGIGAYAAEQDKYVTQSLTAFHPMNGEAKSLYLNILVESGFMGACIYGFVIWRYCRLFRTAKQQTAPLSIVAAIVQGLQAGMIGMAVAGIFDTPILESLRTPATYFLFAYLGSLCVIVNHQSNLASSTQPPSSSIAKLRRNSTLS